jgi:twitching motility two-component system response regulator PilH
MDVVMPLINGFQATRELTRIPETQHIPIVVCSSKDSDTDFLWAKRQGAKGYLIKPIRAPELIALVKRFIAEQG